jgi:hypothetical protein
VALAERLLDLLATVDWPPEFSVDYLRDSYHHTPPEDLPVGSQTERLESNQQRDWFREVVSLTVSGKLQPKLRGVEEVQEDVALFTLDHPYLDARLNEYFTLELLYIVPGVVRRWKQLRELTVGLIPGPRVTDYLRQATICYLYGMPSAASILCRAALEFALEERFIEVLGGSSRRSDLDGLIQSCRSKGLLTEQLAVTADLVRRAGNRAIHQATSTETEALTQIQRTGDILIHLYGGQSSER